MFDSQSLLSRKGPLGNIWIAAYCFKRLRKDQIAETDISSSIDKIVPEDQFSYRILAQLLLGIVRIFSMKVDYLYHDCNEALTNIRKLFTPGQRTFSKEEMCAPFHQVTITVPERFELDLFELEDVDERDRDTPKHQGQSIFEDELTAERNEAPFLNEGLLHPSLRFLLQLERERLPMVKKRKNFIDEITVLSNQTLRECIDDARSLVCKRRKTPQTLLDIWKDYRITSLRDNFMDPLIPYAASERSLKGKVDVQSDIPCKSSDTEFSPHERTSMEIPAPTDNSEAPETSKLNDAEVREATSMEISDTGWDSMDLELAQHEKGSNDKDDGWPIRTRMVAQYLSTRFVHKDQEQKGTMNLACILRGETRRRSAMFFYATLVLKSHRCIDVKQDFPYADIILSATPLLKTLFKNQ